MLIRGLGSARKEILFAITLALVVALYVVVATSFSQRLVLWEAPNEPDRYAEALGMSGATHAASDLVTSAALVPDPPLAILPYAIVLKAQHVRDGPLFRPNPNFLVTTPGGLSEESAIHGMDEMPPFSPGVAAVHSVRLLSIIFGAVSIVVSGYVGLVLFDDAWAAISLAATFALLPSIVFSTSTVQPLAPALLLGTWSLLSCILVAKRQSSLLANAGLGTVGGAASLCTPAALALLPAVVMCGLPALRRTTLTSSSKTAQRNYVPAIARMLVGPLCFVVTCGWWYARALLQEPLDIFAPGSDLRMVATLNKEAALTKVPAFGTHPLIQTFVGRFGWNTVRAPQYVYDIATLITFLAAIGLLASITVLLDPHRRPHWGAVKMWGVVVVICMTSLAFVVGPASLDSQRFPVDGRALVVVAPAWLALIVAGLRGLTRRFNRIVLIGLPVVIAGMSLVGLPGLVRGRYQFAPIWSAPPAAIMTKVGSASWVGAGHIEGFHVTSTTLRAGQHIGVALYWRLNPSATIQAGFQAFVHVALPSGKPIAQKDQQPGGSWYPIGIWQPRDIVEDSHDITIPGDTQPGTYKIIAGAYDLKTLQRFSVSASTWPVIDNGVVLGELVVLDPTS